MMVHVMIWISTFSPFLSSYSLCVKPRCCWTCGCCTICRICDLICCLPGLLPCVMLLRGECTNLSVRGEVRKMLPLPSWSQNDQGIGTGISLTYPQFINRRATNKASIFCLYHLRFRFIGIGWFIGNPIMGNFTKIDSSTILHSIQIAGLFFLCCSGGREAFNGESPCVLPTWDLRIGAAHHEALPY